MNADIVQPRAFVLHPHVQSPVCGLHGIGDFVRFVADGVAGSVVGRTDDDFRVGHVDEDIRERFVHGVGDFVGLRPACAECAGNADERAAE